MPIALELITYTRSQRKVAEFLASPDWRAQWTRADSSGIAFPRFLAEAFSQSMETLRYIGQPFYKMKEVKSPEKNLPYIGWHYFLLMTVLIVSGIKFLKYSTEQPQMFEEA